MAELNETPSALRLHVTLCGRTNSGKSSLLNALVGQQIALVSPFAGTTTDPVNRAVELPGMGACLLTDTAGWCDDGALGELRAGKTRESLMKTDIAILVVTASGGYSEEKEEAVWLVEKGIPYIIVLNKTDELDDVLSQKQAVERAFGKEVVACSAKTGEGIEQLIAAMRQAARTREEERSITGSLVKEGDVVLLVMPQDRQAPKGRLILPQVQTLRELLDKKCLVTCCVTEQLTPALAALAAPPALIITDSQVFGQVYSLKPKESRITSFSILFAAYKGDRDYFVEGVRSLAMLRPDARVLIAEACAHRPQNEDIGRVKLPQLLRKRFGENLRIDIVSGNDFPDSLAGYDIVIQCGACMFGRSHVMRRVEAARAQHVPMTNYGMALAFFSGIFDKVVFPD